MTFGRSSPERRTLPERAARAPPRCSGVNGEFVIHRQFVPEQRGVVTVHQKQRLSHRLFRPT